MATPYPYVSGAVLTAAQLNDGQNLPINDVTANYVLVNNDRYKRVIMNNAGSTTITVNNNVFVTGDVIQISNKGAGSTVVTAGAGVTVNTSGSLTLAQYGGGYLLALSASTFTFFNLGAGALYGTATGGIGAPTAVTISGVNYEYLTFNSTGTLTITKAGFFDYFAIGGGGGAMRVIAGEAGGGGGAGQVVIGSIYLDANQTVTIGAGSSFYVYNTSRVSQAGNTTIGATSPFSISALGNIMTNNFTSTLSLSYVGGGNGTQTGGTIFASTETINNGYRGGNGGGGVFTNAGGGGGQSGRATDGSGTTGGTGGTGVDISTFIGGSASYRATGGGGGGSVTGGAGGNSSASSNAGSTNTTPGSAAANSGSGGGGGIGIITTGNGGSGVVFIRYKV